MSEGTKTKVLKIRRKTLTWSENPEGALIEVRESCVHCGSSLWTDRKLGEELRVDCVACEGENAVTLRRSPGKRTAVVRLPYGCSKWTRVESSNLDAAGVHGLDLLVRFKNGAVYLYPQSGDLYESLVASESKGKFFNVEIKPKRAYLRLCNVYGCLKGARCGEKRCNVHWK